MAHRVPSAQAQLQFLRNVQRLLGEGGFVATYKYALLHALADLAVVYGDQSGKPLELSTYDIAERMTELYWRQAFPYPVASSTDQAMLRQNTDRQAAIVNRIAAVQREHGSALSVIKAHRRGLWHPLVRKVETTLKTMPLWKLQTLGHEKLDFLYEDVGRGTTITLRPGVAYCLANFHGMITNMVRGEWLRHIQRIKHNHRLLGNDQELVSFLFGSERENLAAYRPILREVQKRSCFYCGKRLRSDSTEVDHFVPWSKYPIDLGHNFVLACGSCNGSKSDLLAARTHLHSWLRRNVDLGDELAQRFDQAQLVHDLGSSLRIARWAYRQVASAQGQVWRRPKQIVRLEQGWESAFPRHL